MTRKPALSIRPAEVRRLAGEGSRQTWLDPLLQGVIAHCRTQREQGQCGDSFQMQDLRRLFVGGRNARFPPKLFTVLYLAYCHLFFFKHRQEDFFSSLFHFCSARNRPPMLPNYTLKIFFLGNPT